MIARIWHGKVPKAKAQAYHQYLLSTGLRDYAAVKGNQGVSLLKKEEGDTTHFYTLTYWDDIDAIKRFAGFDYEKARYYPEDSQYLLELEPLVTHYEVMENLKPATSGGEDTAPGTARPAVSLTSKDNLSTKPTTMQAWMDYQAANKDRFLEELLDLLRIPSISARSENKNDMVTCAEAFKARLLEAGADLAEIYPTEGHPVLYAEKITDPSKPTVLVYGHYDVQPADPLELWHSGPFEPVIKDGKIFARGACDDKGQVYMHVKALETMVKTNSLFTNIKFCIEGEEEVGSPNLAKFVKSHKDLLKADVILISDTAMISLDTPSIDIGVRGLSYIEIEVTGPNRDLHSGVYGGTVANPITMLAKMIAACHDENNRITIPGFYDDVIVAAADERKLMAAAPFDEQAYKDDLGVTALWGEKNYTPNERTGIRPTLELNGIWGGYTGEGAKTVLPSRAFAKISARLVPNQSAEKITEKLLKYFTSIAPAGVTVKASEHHGGEPYMTPIDSKAYKAAAQAIKATFGKDPIPVRGGGSIPICSLFEKELGVKIVFMGFGLDSDNLHSPNEKYDIANFYKGIETIPFFHQFFAGMKD